MLSSAGNSWESYSVVGLNEGVVDSDDLDVVVLDAAGLLAQCLHCALGRTNSRIAEDNTSNAAETVDTDLSSTSVAVGS